MRQMSHVPSQSRVRFGGSVLELRTLDEVDEWVRTWAHLSLHESLKRTNPGNVINQFWEEHLTTVSNGSENCGAETDLSKCFDRNSVAAACKALRKYGLDAGVVTSLNGFTVGRQQCSCNKGLPQESRRYASMAC